MIWHWLDWWSVVGLGVISACGPAVSDAAASGTDGATTTDVATTSIRLDLGAGTGSSEGGSVWPQCVPATIGGIHLSAGEPLATPSVAIDATCVLTDVTTGTADLTTVVVSDCLDTAGDPPAMELDLEVYSDQPIALPLPLGRAVAVSLRLSRWGKFADEIWYSLRDPEGRLLLAGFGVAGTRVEPTREADWLAPFSIELGEFVCPPETKGCEGDDNPQRALAEFSDGTSALDVIDGTAERLGDYVLSLAYAREPDYCEGQPTSPRLGGLLVLDP